MLAFGMVGILAAVILAIANIEGVLSVWWNIAGIVSGGILGLFLLGWLVPRCSSRSAAISVVVGVLLTVWLTLGPLLPSPLHVVIEKKWILVFATVTILAVGTVLAASDPQREDIVEKRPRAGMGD